MANEIYLKSWWGRGVCDNSVNWGLVYKEYAGCSAVPGLLATLQARATYYENQTCTTAILEDIENIQYTAPVLPTGLLADYPNASAAYSLRNLIDTTTSVVRVRRSSDNTEQDFTATEITDGTLTTFTGANDGFVTTWYDQSGNNEDAAQATATSQPKIVTNGVVELLNGKPTLLGNGTSTYMPLDTSSYNIGNLSSFVVLEYLTSNVNSIVFGLSGNSSRWFIIDWGTSKMRLSYNEDFLLNPPIEELGDKLITQIAGTIQGNYQGFVNSVSLANDTLISEPSSTSQTGLFGIGNQYFANAQISEIIIYPSDQSANRTGIETNINTEYTIY
jgi:hypothetical protein